MPTFLIDYVLKEDCQPMNRGNSRAVFVNKQAVTSSSKVLWDGDKVEMKGLEELIQTNFLFSASLDDFSFQRSPI